MIPESIFTVIIPRLFLIVLGAGALYSIWKAIVSGTISYGYKYYKPEQVCTRDENPFGFWMGVGMYGVGIAVVASILVFIW